MAVIFAVAGFRTLSAMRDEPLTYTLIPGQREGTTILKLTGPLTLANLFSFQEEFRAIKPPAMILDLSGSPYMDSAGLGLIMNYYVSAERRGNKLLLVAVNDRIAALLKVVKVNDILPSFPTIEQAEASL